MIASIASDTQRNVHRIASRYEDSLNQRMERMKNYD